MDNDRVSGATKPAGGVVSKAVGKVIDRTRPEVEGAALYIAGNAQGTIGDSKDPVAA
jgi:uncharacterized protein YjbJ (UPF0337 family)